MSGGPARDVLGEAERVVRRARLRVVGGSALAAAAWGVLAGAGVGLIGAVVLFAVDTPAPLWLLLIPVAGAAVAVVRVLRRPAGVEAAAVALDFAAGSDEAFVSALSARDAAPEMRALSAEYALARCGARDVSRILRIPTPAAAAAAVLSLAALAAVVLVPASLRVSGPVTDAPISQVSGGTGPRSAAGGVVPAVVSPEARAAEIAAAAKRGDDDAVRRLAPEVRGDLAAVGDDELRAVAAALAERGVVGARDALAALDRGDRAAAVDLLRTALGFRDAGIGADVVGGGAPGAVPREIAGTADPRIPASWPLRYDRAVRQWLEIRNEDRREERK